MKINKQLRANVNKHKAKILEAHGAGLTANETAQLIGISSASIYRYSWVMGIKWKYQNPESKIPDKRKCKDWIPHVMPGPREAEKIAMWRDAGEKWPHVHKQISPRSQFEPWYSTLYQNRQDLFTPGQLARAFKGPGHRHPEPQPEPPQVRQGWLKRFLIWLNS